MRPISPISQMSVYFIWKLSIQKLIFFQEKSIYTKYFLEDKTQAIYKAGRFFVAFLKWFDDISTSKSCFWITTFKYSSSFDFWYQIQPIRKQWGQYLIRNFFWCRPFVELIRKRKAEQLLTKIRSVNEERDSRSLKQQGPFLNASSKWLVELISTLYKVRRVS